MRSMEPEYRIRCWGGQWGGAGFSWLGTSDIGDDDDGDDDGGGDD